MFWEDQNLRNCKKALDVCKKLLAHNSSFWTLQEVVQVADYKNSEKLIKTLRKFILLVKMSNILILAEVLKQKSKSLSTIQKVVQVADYKGFTKPL